MDNSNGTANKRCSRTHDRTATAKTRGRAVTLLTLLGALVVLIAGAQTGSAVGISSSLASSAAITSDKADYSAGSQVTLTGSGWMVGESVHIFVNDSIGQAWSLNSDPDPIAGLDGSFTFTFNLPIMFIANYTVTATGASSGMATTSFTDAPPAGNLDQCRNGTAANRNDCLALGGSSGWVNGNVGDSQAHMLEGYSTPFREVMTSLPTGIPIELTIGYDIKHDGNAYDYLTSYNRLEPHAFFGHAAEAVDPTSGTGVSGSADTFPIPAPGSAGSPVANQPTASFNSLPTAERVMSLWGGHITDVQYVSQGSLTDANSETQVKIAFTASSSTAVLAWGGHIAQCSVWGLDASGKCRSAGGIEGSPYHMRNIDWNLNNLGHTDRSMKANVVVPPGNLTLAKSLTGGPNGYTGPFAINYNCGLPFIGSVPVSEGSPQTIDGIPSGSVCTISETLPAPPGGYTFGTPTFSPSNTVTIGAGTTVTVTTNNTLTRDVGSLVLAKSLTGGPNGYTGPFTIHYDCGGGIAGDKSVVVNGTATVPNIPTGTICTVSEPNLPSVPGGYSFDAPTFSPSATVTIPADGTSVNVTTNNTLIRDIGSLQIVKTVDNPDSAPLPAKFKVDYDCGGTYKGQVQVDKDNPAVVPNIPTGSVCSVTEVTPDPIPGYSWGTIGYTPDTVTIDTKGQTFTITVANTISRDRGSLVLAKSLTGGPAGYTGPFSIHYDCGAGFIGDKSVAVGDSATVPNIPSGTSCKVSEPNLPNVPVGYSFGAPSFDPSDTVTIPAGNGSSVTVTTHNSLTRDLGSLQIVKTVSNPDGANVPASFKVNYDCGAGFADQVNVAEGSPQTVPNIPTGSVCSVTEVAPDPIAGYTWGTITYTPATLTIDTKGQTFTITVGNSISRDRGKIIVKKVTDPANTGSFTFTTGPVDSGYQGFTLGGGGHNDQILPTGTYTVQEATQLGWILTGIGGSPDPNTPFACTVEGGGGSFGTGDLNTGTATITLKKGDTVTCVFENTGVGVTRTQGFWATHPQLAEKAWFGGSGFGVPPKTLPGVAVVIGDATLCGRPIDSLAKLMGGFWSGISKTSTGGKRSSLDQGRMQLLQQLLAAELNASAFGSLPQGGIPTIDAWEAAYCGTNQTTISNAQGQAASFNSAGDGQQFTPGTSADSKYAKTIANLAFWDRLPAG